ALGPSYALARGPGAESALLRRRTRRTDSGRYRSDPPAARCAARPRVEGEPRPSRISELEPTQAGREPEPTERSSEPGARDKVEPPQVEPPQDRAVAGQVGRGSEPTQDRSRARGRARLRSQLRTGRAQGRSRRRTGRGSEPTQDRSVGRSRSVGSEPTQDRSRQGRSGRSQLRTGRAQDRSSPLALDTTYGCLIRAGGRSAASSRHSPKSISTP
ncbi:MAG: hypothetical protein QOI41_3259, partial [Myxococcales bacterium]|nr:hypothetical protein [Myxococcales bacterium]